MHNSEKCKRYPTTPPCIHPDFTSILVYFPSGKPPTVHFRTAECPEMDSSFYAKIDYQRIKGCAISMDSAAFYLFNRHHRPNNYGDC